MANSIFPDGGGGGSGDKMQLIAFGSIYTDTYATWSGKWGAYNTFYKNDDSVTTTPAAFTVTKKGLYRFLMYWIVVGVSGASGMRVIDGSGNVIFSSDPAGTGAFMKDVELVPGTYTVQIKYLGGNTHGCAAVYRVE